MQNDTMKLVTPFMRYRFFSTKKLSASGHMFGATFRKNSQTCKIPLKLFVKFSNEHYVKYNKNLVTIN